jgi:chemotaxis protein MotB
LGKWFLALVLLLALALGAAYYWLYRPQQQALARTLVQASDCAGEVHRLKGRMADLETIQDDLRKTGADLQKQIAEKEQALSALRSTHDDLVGALQQEIANRQVEVERVRDRLRVDLVDEILFDSGVAELKPQGVTVLQKIGAVLARATDRGLEVQGHTDNVPIRGALTHRYATNWELSAARAVNVARFLQDQAGVDPKRVSALAFGEHQPRDSNDTEAGRRKNRRIEILLVPIAAFGQRSNMPAPPPAEPAKPSSSPKTPGFEAGARKGL